MPSMKQSERPNWPVGRGEMEGLIHAYDWSATSLGPLAAWPQSLKTTVDILLHSPAPMALFWGADGITIYNNAYAEFAGAMHPALLGSTMLEAWPWDREFAANVLRAGLAGGSLSYRDQEFALYRNGKTEHVWLNLDYSPVLEDNGKPAGILAILLDNTEKVRAENTLRDSEEHFRLALKNSPLVVFTQDKALRYTWVFNPRLGYSIHDILGKTDDTLHSMEVASSLIKLKRRVLDSGSGAREEVKVSRDGHDYFYDLTIEPLRDAHGEIVGIACAAMDVTERREAEQARTTAEKALARQTRQLMDAQRLAHIGSWDWDLETDTVIWSDEHFRIFGLHPTTYRPTYESNMHFIHPDDRQKGWDAIIAAMAARQPLNVELRLVRADGAERYVISRGEVTFDDAGRPVRMVGTIQDITERKLAEEALRESEARFRALAEASPALISQLDPDGKAVYLNQRHLEFFGGTAADLMNTGWHAIVHPDDAPAYMAAVEQALHDRARFQRRVRVRSRSGEWRWLEAYAMPWFTADGQYAGHVCVSIDITEAVLLERSQNTYRMATEGGNEGFYIVRPIRNKEGTFIDFEIIDCNRRGAEFLGRQREDLIGKKISTLYPEGEFERPREILRRTMETGFYEDDLEVSGKSPLRVRWIHCKIVRSYGDLAVTLRDISDAKARVHELERRGNEDALTGLPNRYWVQTCLPQAIERAATNHAMLAVLFMDLDGFKAVNDALGHPAGDELLRIAARRLKVAVRPQDRVARLGGDEFVIILENIAHKRDAAHVAERVVQAFQQSFTLPQGVQSVGASIGISLFPSDGTDAETLLRNADIAMYSVKTGGKRNYHFFDSEFYGALRNRLEQEAELRDAVERDQFIMYYQPRVEMTTGAASSMEALVRWVHPSRGLVEPLEFIPLAEETGLILGLGELVIEKVCCQLERWAHEGKKLLPVSINVSPRQFIEANIAEILLGSLLRHHIDPALIEIELKESPLMENDSDAANKLAAIRGMGVKLLLDDFGTGNSSLSQLQCLEFDMLKVDRALTAAMETTEKGKVFYKALITMAHALGMRIVAEGIEDEQQMEILKSLCCDELQGFYISRPLPPSETQCVLPKWLSPSIASGGS
jgi:diguanylate cyclase (GGDEF)-like protein/PAS domain S-box-containing protein